MSNNKVVQQYQVIAIKEVEAEKRRHPKCLGYRDYFGDYDCGYSTSLTCDDCKYGFGRKDPEAKCNRLK